MGYIRFFLAICVIFAHAGPLPVFGYMAGGLVAVLCFFILSGFYMALVLDQKYQTVAPFYWNRFSRIFSGYWVALVFALIVMYLCHDNLFQRIFSSNLTMDAKAFLVASNVLIFGTDFSLFLDATQNGLSFVSSAPGGGTSAHQYLELPQSWSLPVELMFYIMAPFCCRSPVRLIILFVASYASLLWLTGLFGNVDPWAARVFPVTVMYFVSGALCYRLLPLAKRSNRAWGFLAMAVVLFGITTLDILPTDLRWLIFPAIAIATPFIICTISGRIEQMLGEVSYMVYLSHIPVLYALQYLGHASMPLVVVLSICVSFVLLPIVKALDNAIRSRFPRRNRQYERVEI